MLSLTFSSASFSSFSVFANSICSRIISVFAFGNCFFFLVAILCNMQWCYLKLDEYAWIIFKCRPKFNLQLCVFVRKLFCIQLCSIFWHLIKKFQTGPSNLNGNNAAANTNQFSPLWNSMVIERCVRISQLFGFYIKYCSNAFDFGWWLHFRYVQTSFVFVCIKETTTTS